MHLARAEKRPCWCVGEEPLGWSRAAAGRSPGPRAEVNRMLNRREFTFLS